MLCKELQRTREEQVATALELARRRPVRAAAGLCARCAGLRRFFRPLRLRVSPRGELSGLGAADIQGKILIGSAYAMLRRMKNDSRSERRASTANLDAQVRDLKALVESQDALLTALAQRRVQRRFLGSP